MITHIYISWHHLHEMEAEVEDVHVEMQVAYFTAHCPDVSIINESLINFIHTSCSN